MLLTNARAGRDGADGPVAGERSLGAGFRWLSLVALATTYALVVLGGVVRATGSGDACPDWPRCHGQLIPPFETAVLIEFSHRLLASVVGFLVLAVAIVAWRNRRDYPVIAWAALTAVAMVIGQIVLGGLTVLNDLSPNLVLAHLAMASILLATLLVITFLAFAPRPQALVPRPETPAAQPARSPDRSIAFRNQAVLAAIAIFALMLTGSYVSGSGASLAYRDWPLFDGQLLPDGGRLAVIHATHRFAALLVGLFVAHVAAKAWRTQRDDKPVLYGAAFALTLYVAQAMAGAANIWTLLQPAAIATHLALAVALWATLVAVALFAHRAAQSAGETQPAARAAGPQTRAEPAAGPLPAPEST